jgi:hypothetical protein
MVGHEAVAQKTEPAASGVEGEDLQVSAIVRGGKEDRLAIVAALRDVMRYAGDDYAGATGHI